MARVLVTGSADGLGRMAAELLLEQGHAVVLHARNEQRAEAARSVLPGAAGVVVADVSSLAGMRSAAEQAGASGRFDAVVHNVAVGYRERQRVETEDGLAQVFAVNVLAPYVLTALLERPDRLVYLSSGMHRGGDPDLSDPQWERRRWNGSQAYADSKLFDLVLALAVARRWPDVRSNAVDPGWVPTQMGGAGAPDDLDQAHRTQVELAVGDGEAARGTGGLHYHLAPRQMHPAARSTEVQEELLAYCAQVSGVSLP